MDEQSSQSHASCTCNDFDNLREKLKLRVRIQSEFCNLREALLKRECDLLTELEGHHVPCGNTTQNGACGGQLGFQSDFDAWKQQLEGYGQLVLMDPIQGNQLSMGGQTDTGEDELKVDLETFEFVDFATPETSKWNYQMVCEAERKWNEKEEGASCCSVDSFDVIRPDCSGVKVDDSGATKQPQLASTPAVHPTSARKSNSVYPTFYLPNLQKRGQNRVAGELAKIDKQKNALEANVTEPKCCSRDLSFSAWLESEDQKNALEANVGPTLVYRQLEKIENQKNAEDASVTESKRCSGGLGLNDWLKFREANVRESKCCSVGQGNSWLKSENQKNALEANVTESKCCSVGPGNAWLRSENALEANVTESKCCSVSQGNAWLRSENALEANVTESKCCSVGAWLYSENQKNGGTPADAIKASFQAYLQGGGVSIETWILPKGEKEYEQWVAKKSPSKGVGTSNEQIVVTLSRQLKSFAI